jgi:hypothetical protein
MVGVYEYSSVSILCWVLILHIVLRFSYTNGSRVLADMNVIGKQLRAPEPPETFVTEEQMQALVPEITAQINTTLQLGYSLLAGECTTGVLQAVAVLFVISLASRIFGTTGLFFLLFVAAFSLPKGYELKKKEVDQGIEVLKKSATDVWAKAIQSIPKASDLKVKEENATKEEKVVKEEKPAKRTMKAE